MTNLEKLVFKGGLFLGIGIGGLIFGSIALIIARFIYT